MNEQSKSEFQHGISILNCLSRPILGLKKSLVSLGEEVAGSNLATPTAKTRVSEGQLQEPFFICTKVELIGEVNFFTEFARMDKHF